MNNINIKLHDYQKQILSILVNKSEAKFTELLLNGLESEHMNYHLKKLVDYELVDKSDNVYFLTDKGKDYSNLMDDDVEFIEKQPKVSVLLHVVRLNSEGEVEHLLSKRLRQPYLGKIGRLTGKVRFGETLEQSALRELYEETGLYAKYIKLEQVYHKLRHKGDSYLQDNIFFRFFIKDVYGQFISSTRHQENLWLTKKDILSGDYDVFEDLVLDNRFEPNEINFTENDSVAKDY